MAQTKTFLLLCSQDIDFSIKRIQKPECEESVVFAVVDTGLWTKKKKSPFVSDNWSSGLWSDKRDCTEKNYDKN